MHEYGLRMTQESMFQKSKKHPKEFEWAYLTESTVKRKPCIFRGKKENCQEMSRFLDGFRG